MRKTTLSFAVKSAVLLAGLCSLLFISCKPTVNPGDNGSGTENESGSGSNSGSSGTNSPAKGETVYEIDAGKSSAAHSWNIASISLQAFANKTVNIDFTADMKVANTGSTANIMWGVNAKDKDGNAVYPTIASKEFASGTSAWTTVKGTGSSIILGDYPVLYISSYGLTPEKLTISVKNIKAVVTEVSDSANTKTLTDITVETGVTKTAAAAEENNKQEEDDTPAVVYEGSWLDEAVPSIYKTYKDYFDSIGIAAEYGNFGLKQNGSDKYTATYTANGYFGTPSELYYEEIQKGIAKHANSITLGNELKPQFLLQWWGNDCDNTLVKFTASDDLEYDVPEKLNGENLIYATLNVCKAMGVQMRGHVLTWHSQTDEAFYRVNYKKDGALVDKATMTARHEWYIKTVLECVDAWEKANSYKAIWAWDVVNESMADDAGKTYTGDSQNWLRGSTAGTKDKDPSAGGSRWYQIYGNEEFITNAFKFAVKYGPSDIKLCYNDYNEYWDAEGHYKTSAIEHIAGLIKAAIPDDADRFVIAMQSHVGTSWPGVTGYESALKRFLAIADVHVSEIDFSAETQALGTKAWGDYFTMLKKYGKKYSGTHKVTNVTIWGINNESSWINPANDGGKKTYPLLFNLKDNVSKNTKEVTYDTGKETLPQYDVGDTYIPNDAFSAVINAAK